METAFTPIANNINRLVETVALSYMALHGQRSEFFSRVVGCSAEQQRRHELAHRFMPICNGSRDQPAYKRWAGRPGYGIVGPV